MATILLTDFENDTWNPWGFINSAVQPVIVNLGAHQGTKCLQVSLNPAVGGWYGIPSTPHVKCTLAVKLNTLPDVGTGDSFMGFQSYTDETNWSLPCGAGISNVDVGGVIVPRWTMYLGTTYQFYDASIELNRWYVMSLDYDSATRTVTLTVDGTPILTGTAEVGDVANYVYFGAMAAYDGGWSPNGIAWFDDIAIESVEGTQATTLTFNCSPTSGVLPWDASMSGRLTDGVGVGVPNALIQIQTFTFDWNPAGEWLDTGIYTSTDVNGDYAVTYPFRYTGTIEGWDAGDSQPMRARYEALYSNAIQVTMEGAPPDWITPLAVGATSFVAMILVVKVARGGKKKKRKR